MEISMNKNILTATVLIGLTALSGCAATKNIALTEAHDIYNKALLTPQVANLAAMELKDADNTLSKADQALKDGESVTNVNHLAYMAKLKVNIAQEAAERKSAEATIETLNANISMIRLEARTAEADAAQQQLANAKLVADQQAAALLAANASAARNQAIIEQQEIQLKDLNAKKTKRGLVVTLGDVLFNTNKAQLKTNGTRSVQKLADFLKKYPHHKVLIEGYTDSVGSEKLNQKLSERRANTVRETLNSMGIDNERISTQGYGEMFPIVKNNTKANRQTNRRVEIVVSDESGNIGKR
jgi:outer membrane protein OmpA-like peptidoglycan-associated protein